MKLKSFEEIDNITQVQFFLLKACLANSKEEREIAVRNWEELVVIDELDFSCSRLIPYFLYRNQQHGIVTLHDKRMKVIYKHWWLRTQHISHQLKKVHEAFFDSGIDVVVIKGASIKMHYEREELRPMADFDLLIRPKDLAAAIQVLKALDYSVSKKNETRICGKNKNVYIDFNHAISCIHQHECRLDLHWKIGSKCSVQFSDKLWLNLQDYGTMPNAKIPQLAYQVFVIIIHAVDSRNKDNLNWILDIAVINKKADPFIWEEARRLAIAEKKEALFDYGCSILIKLGVFAPDPGKVKRPKQSISISPKSENGKNHGNALYISFLNLIYSVNNLFPHSNIFIKIFQITRRVYFFCIRERE